MRQTRPIAISVELIVRSEIRTDSKTIVAPESVSRRVELHDDTDVDRVLRVEYQLRPNLALLSPNSSNSLAIAEISLARDLGGV